jgi:hypothetical protein
MTEEGPLLANLLLEGIWDENVVTEEIVELVRNKPFPVQVEPVYLENENESQIQTKIRITNDSDFPMSVDLKGYVHPSAVYRLEQTEITVPPNDVATFGLDLINQDSVDLTGIDPVTINAEVTYQYEGRADIVFDKTILFAPLAKYTVGKSAKKIKIDGNLKEWNGEWITLNDKNVTGKPFHYNGPEDCTVKFQSTYDDEFLFIGLDVIDDEVVINENASHWAQDAFGIGVDARPQHISETNNGAGQYSEWFSYLRAFKETSSIYYEESVPEGVISEFKITKSGVQIELAIPVSVLDKMNQGSWKTARLAIAYIDSDNGGKETNQIWWFPGWNTVKTINGSGMMFRE